MLIGNAFQHDENKGKCPVNSSNAMSSDRNELRAECEQLHFENLARVDYRQTQQ